MDLIEEFGDCPVQDNPLYIEDLDKLLSEELASVFIYSVLCTVILFKAYILRVVIMYIDRIFCHTHDRRKIIMFLQSY